MSEVTASLVKELRDKTGAGMMDCKNALVETNGNIEESIDWLRKKGISGAEKKSARVAADGVIAVSINTDAAALVEINSETDFVSRNPDFQKFAKNISEIALINGQTIEELKKAAEAIDRMHSSSGPSQMAGQNENNRSRDRRDPLGRVPPGQGSSPGGDVGLPNEPDITRARKIAKQLYLVIP